MGFPATVFIDCQAMLVRSCYSHGSWTIASNPAINLYTVV